MEVPGALRPASASRLLSSRPFPGAGQRDPFHFPWSPGAPGNRGALASGVGVLAVSLVSWRPLFGISVLQFSPLKRGAVIGPTW